MERVIVWHRWSPPIEPSREAMAFALGWRDLSRERFQGIEGELLLEIGGSLVVSLPVGKLTRAIDLCLSLVREAEREETNAGGLSFGVAVGNVGRVPADGGSWVGDAIDRAQGLANAAGTHELVLDANAQAAAAHHYLFSREVMVGASVGAMVDRAFPRRAECARALVHLRKPPFAAEGQAQYEALRRLARTPGRHRVLLFGPHGSGVAEWIAHIARELAPPAWLEVRAVGASLAPLSGLMYALRRLPPHAAPERVLLAEDQAALQALIAVRSGRAVSRRDAVLALRQYVLRCAHDGRRALITVDPTAAIDPGTIGVLAETARDQGPDLLLLLSLAPDAKPPEGLRGGLTEVRVRGLSSMEARMVAAEMLGDTLPSDIARRAATMGGSSPHAVAEALRVLVAAGDVVWEGSAFRWRRGPAGRINTLPLETLLEERYDALAAPLRRALEVLATVPDPDDRALCAEVAASDGLLDETFARAVEELDALGLVGADARGTEVSEPMRAVVHAAMTPARAEALHRSVARALDSRIGAHHEFALATLAYYRARAGEVTDAAALFLEVATRAGQHGFVRSGVRLAAAAVEADASDATRSQAATIAERLSERQLAAKPSQVELDPLAARKPDAAARRPSLDVATQARARAIQALLARDFEEVERALELLVAAGRDGASVDRLRALTMLAKGDREGAALLLARAHEAAEEQAEAPRMLLSQALLALANDAHTSAVRIGLRALSRARQGHDAAGERASLSVLALCYRALGRGGEAAQLAQAALEAGAGARAQA